MRRLSATWESATKPEVLGPGERGAQSTVEAELSALRSLIRRARPGWEAEAREIAAELDSFPAQRVARDEAAARLARAGGEPLAVALTYARGALLERLDAVGIGSGGLDRRVEQWRTLARLATPRDSGEACPLAQGRFVVRSWDWALTLPAIAFTAVASQPIAVAILVGLGATWFVLGHQLVTWTLRAGELEVRRGPVSRRLPLRTVTAVSARGNRVDVEGLFHETLLITESETAALSAEVERARRLDELSFTLTPRVTACAATWAPLQPAKQRSQTGDRVTNDGEAAAGWLIAAPGSIGFVPQERGAQIAQTLLQLPRAEEGDLTLLPADSVRAALSFEGAVDLSAAPCVVSGEWVEFSGDGAAVRCRPSEAVRQALAFRLASDHDGFSGRS